MLGNEKMTLKRDKEVIDGELTSDENLHTLGVSYVSNFLDRVGFTILKTDTDPNHHSQIVARIFDKSLLIAVRTACHPEIGTIDSSSLERLLGESEQGDLVPYFAGLSVTPAATHKIDMDGSTQCQQYKVIFNGISAINKAHVRAVND
jgi:hypothetical protein